MDAHGSDASIVSEAEQRYARYTQELHSYKTDLQQLKTSFFKRQIDKGRLIPAAEQLAQLGPVAEPNNPEHDLALGKLQRVVARALLDPTCQGIIAADTLHKKVRAQTTCSAAPSKKGRHLCPLPPDTSPTAALPPKTTAVSHCSSWLGAMPLSTGSTWVSCASPTCPASCTASASTTTCSAACWTSTATCCSAHTTSTQTHCAGECMCVGGCRSACQAGQGSVCQAASTLTTDCVGSLGQQRAAQHASKQQQAVRHAITL